MRCIVNTFLQINSGLCLVGIDHTRCGVVLVAESENFTCVKYRSNIIAPLTKNKQLNVVHKKAPTRRQRLNTITSQVSMK